MTTPISPDAQRKIANRLKRARGQLSALIDAVENGDDCRAVITQLSAVSSAIDKAGFAIVSSVMKECVTGDAEDKDMSVDELEKLFLTLA